MTALRPSWSSRGPGWRVGTGHPHRSPGRRRWVAFCRTVLGTGCIEIGHSNSRPDLVGERTMIRGSVFGDHRVIRRPFTHAVTGPLLSEPASDALRRWCALKAKWNERRSDHYRFSCCEATTGLEECSPGFMAAVGALSNELALMFQAPLLPPKSVDVFRFQQGDFIGIHNDKGIRAVRLVSYIPGQQPTQSGGALVLFGENDEETLLYGGGDHATSIFFLPSALTFHAITRVGFDEILLLVADYLAAAS